MMGRRSFLSVLGLGSVAATLDAPVATNGISLGSQMVSNYPDVQKWSDKTYSITDHIKGLQQELSYYDDKEKYIQDRIHGWMDELGCIDVNRIDPDIRAMKSFSDSTKIRLHTRRQAEKSWEKQRGSLLRQIASLMKDETDD